MQFTRWNDTIVALATAQGIAAIGVIRISGANSFNIIDSIFTKKKLSTQKTHSVHIGFLEYKSQKIDEVVVTIFKNPKSYTGEDVIEISCHGSPFIQQQIINIIELGARLALPGEFTQRAFLNKKLDLTQAESVADIIASETESAQQTALQQMNGGFSNDIKILRNDLIEFAALIELELDFSEEDVAFADKKKLEELIDNLLQKIGTLLNSFKLGNIIKNGVTTVIAGRPNAGKSTLLNTILNEERAIVTEIAGTTRDTIEEKIIVDSIVFKLIDTAGIRESTDIVEKRGIEKSLEKINTASILLYVFDVNENSVYDVIDDIKNLNTKNQKIVLIANKIDCISENKLKELLDLINKLMPLPFTIFPLSANNKTQIEHLLSQLPTFVINEKIDTNKTIVVNSRHYEALNKCNTSLLNVKKSLGNNISGDLLALEIKYSLQYLGEITGEILHDKDILGTIFGKFCIGK